MVRLSAGYWDNGLMRLQHLSIGVLLCLAICSSAQTPAVPTDWQTSTTLPGIDLTSLTALQKPVVLGILRETPCTCGCGMKLAECRVKDPACSYSKALAKLANQSVSAGKSKVEV